jgi:hypothetical protein
MEKKEIDLEGYTKEELKFKKGEFLQETIKRCLEREPALNYDELAFVIMEFLDQDKFLKAVKKEHSSKY